MQRVKRYKLKRKKRFYFIIIILIAIVAFSFFIKSGFHGIGLKLPFTAGIPSDEPSPATGQDTSTKPSATSKTNISSETSENQVKDKENQLNKNKLSSSLAEVLEIDAALKPSAFKKFNSEVLVNRKAVSDYKREFQISLGNAGEYSSLEGVTCFRGSNYRQNASYGYAEVNEQKLKKVWSMRNGSIDIWTGTGWNGQPSIVKWSDEVRNIMNIYPEKKKKADLKEVIYATLDGKIYFMDAEDGKPTRPAIDVGYPHKGSVVIDPRGYPLLYAGQGIPDKNGKPVPIGYRIFSLIDQKCLYFIDGRDKDAYRNWGAFDSGPIIDADTDSIILCGENGIIYSGKLNTSLDMNKGTISIKPDLVKYRYHSPVSTKIGTENSPAIYKNLAFFADNSGFFQCLNLNTLKPVWVRDVTDDTDSTTAIEEEANSVSLYTACEVDHQGANGASYIRKINALSGELLWEKKVAAAYDPKTNGGALASPIIGQNDIDGLVIYNIAKTGKGNAGTLFALDKKTGKEVWTVKLKHYCWSSPVAVYTKEGKSYIVQCDSAGQMFLYEGTTGRQLDCIELGSNIEASPAIYENTIVVGTRGQLIYGIKIL